MKVVEYTGRTATKRVIRKIDFTTNGVDDQDEITFNVVDIRTRGQAEVSDNAAELLLRVEPNSFREVTGDKRALVFRRDSGTSGASDKDAGGE